MTSPESPQPREKFIPEEEAIAGSLGAGLGNINCYAVPEGTLVTVDALVDSFRTALVERAVNNDNYISDCEFLDLVKKTTKDESLREEIYVRDLPQGGSIVYQVAVNRHGRPTVDLEGLKNTELEEHQIKSLAVEKPPIEPRKFKAQINPDAFTFIDVSIELMGLHDKGIINQETLDLVLAKMARMESKGQIIADNIRESKGKYYLVLDTDDDNLYFDQGGIDE